MPIKILGRCFISYPLDKVGAEESLLLLHVKGEKHVQACCKVRSVNGIALLPAKSAADRLRTQINSGAGSEKGSIA